MLSLEDIVDLKRHRQEEPPHMSAIDLAFPVRGNAIPADHGYALYAALSRVVPQIHEHPEVAVHRICGQPAEDSVLLLNDRSQLTVRLQAGQIPTFLPLAGQTLSVEGQSLSVGVPHVLALRPAARLAAHMVTIKGFMEPEGFLEAARRQVDANGISNEVLIGIPKAEPGRPDEGEPIRRVIRIKDKTIVGFAVQVSGLTAEESITLQEHGIGGRRHMGCGIFVPFQ